jgi:hypothetical protein
VRRSISGRQPRIVLQPAGHLRHQAGGLESADLSGRPWAGEVVQRWKWSSVTQPWRSRHNVGVAARTAVGDFDDVPRRTSELGRHYRLIPRGQPVTGQRPAGPRPSSGNSESP